MPNQYNAPENQLVLCTCATCGETFYRPPSLINGQHTFCSRACFRREPVPIATRLMRRVVKTDDCWLWTGNINHAGYGQMSSGGRGSSPVLTHRAAWEIVAGPIPDGMFVCHVCDNRACVRNDDEGWHEVKGVLRPRRGHLFLGTPEDNMTDMVQKERQARGAQKSIAKFTDDEVREIRARYAAGGVMQKELAAEFGVSRGTMSQLISRQLWKHIS